MAEPTSRGVVPFTRLLYAGLVKCPNESSAKFIQVSFHSRVVKFSGYSMPEADWSPYSISDLRWYSSQLTRLSSGSRTPSWLMS